MPLILKGVLLGYIPWLLGYITAVIPSPINLIVGLVTGVVVGFGGMHIVLKLDK